MIGHDLDPIVGARQAVAAGCADIAPIVMWAYLDSTVKEYDALTAKLAAAEQERDAYKRAKAENDERFMLRYMRAEAALEAVRELRHRATVVEVRRGRQIHRFRAVGVIDLEAALAAAEQDEPKREQS